MGNLNFRTSQDDLAALMLEAGTVVDLHLPIDRITGQPRGIAFVEFSTEEEAAKAIEQFDGHDLDGRPLRVNEAEERPPRPGPGGGDRDRGNKPQREYRSNKPPARRSAGGAGFGGKPGGGGKKRKGGSRRGLRAKKRSF